MLQIKNYWGIWMYVTIWFLTLVPSLLPGNALIGSNSFAISWQNCPGLIPPLVTPDTSLSLESEGPMVVNTTLNDSTLQSPILGYQWGRPILEIREHWRYPIPISLSFQYHVTSYHTISPHTIPCHLIPSFQSYHRMSGVLLPHMKIISAGLYCLSVS